MTTRVTTCRCRKDSCDVEIIAIDCPGLHDGTSNETVYLQEVYDTIQAHGGVDLHLYCKRMDDTRASAESDADVIRKLTNKLGKELWQHTLFVLTFGNIYEKRLQQRLHKDKVSTEFKQKKEAWKREIEEIMKICDVRCNVIVFAAGYKRPDLCGSQYWLSDFWASSYEQIQNENAACALLRLNQLRIVDKASKESFTNNLDAQPLVFTKKLKKVLGAVKGVG